MDITLKDKNGVVLHTANKYCEEDINVSIETQEISMTPSVDEQVQEGLFGKVIVFGDENLVSENIKKGINLFGVEGGFDAVDTRDATATSNDIVQGTTAYVNNIKINGNVPNNGELEFEPSDEEQVIPAGLTSGGMVKAADITKLSEYEVCLTLANSIENPSVYEGTTATALDIKKGKTAYSNGEKITGELEIVDGGELETSFISSLDISLGANCTKLPESLTSIRKYAFYQCTNLALTELPDTVTDIQINAFYQCTNLALTKLPSNLQMIRGYAFYQCTNLALTELPDTVIDIDDQAFRGCSKLALTKLPNNLEHIGAMAFYDCKKLEITEIPQSVTSLEGTSFQNCTKLKTIVVHENIKSIDSSTFRGCTSLTEVTLKGAIKTIAIHSFNGCSNLTKFVMPNITGTITLGGTNAFEGTPIANGAGYIYIPDDLVDTFKSNTNWGNFADQIKPISELN